MEFGNLPTALAGATPRIIEVSELSRARNGFAYQVTIGLETNSDEPFTAEELDAVVKAAWESAPWDVNTFLIAAGAETPDGYVGVDLRTAAAELSPLRARDMGQGGVTLTGMAERYGEKKDTE